MPKVSKEGVLFHIIVSKTKASGPSKGGSEQGREEGKGRKLDTGVPHSFGPPLLKLRSKLVEMTVKLSGYKNPRILEES